MIFFKSLENQIIKHDLVNKYKYPNITKLPKLKKIILNFEDNHLKIKKLATNFLALEILTSKENNLINSQTQINYPIWSNTILTKKKLYNFLERLIIQFLPKCINFKTFIKIPKFSFKFSLNNIIMQEIENYYSLFNNLPIINIIIMTNAKNNNELLFLLKLIKIPILKINR